MSIDTILRDTLRAHADGAPGGAGLLDAARGRARRQRRRHLTTLAGVAVLTVATAAVGGPALYQAAGDAGPVIPAAPSLEPAAFELPRFPFTPTWTPSGVGAAFIGVHEDGTSLSHEILATGGGSITVDVSRVDPTPTVAARLPDRAEPVEVNGRPAILRVELVAGDVRAVALTWRHGPEQWVTVYGENGTGVDDVLRYARSLAESPSDVTAPFTLLTAPAGARVSHVQRNLMEFRPAAGDPVRGYPGRVGIELYGLDGGLEASIEDAGPTTPGQPIRVAGHDAELFVDDDAITVGLLLGDGMVLAVTSSGTLRLELEDLVTLAAGVQLTEHARPRP